MPPFRLRETDLSRARSSVLVGGEPLASEDAPEINRDRFTCD